MALSRFNYHFLILYSKDHHKYKKNKFSELKCGMKKINTRKAFKYAV